ncbi:MAG: hypothetical protein P4M14_13405 [Gammaproteobacteria bacterium]|nr:hypothetical protein [Gammaproteobacteria bacterium]
MTVTDSASLKTITTRDVWQGRIGTSLGLVILHVDLVCWAVPNGFGLQEHRVCRSLLYGWLQQLFSQKIGLVH